MKLYSNKFAPSPRRVRMFAAEKGRVLDIVEVDIAAGEHRSREYLAVNPLGELPTLQLADGSHLGESVAICRWLEEQHPQPNLFGRTPRERAAINSWIDRLMFRLYVPTTHVFRHTHPFWATRLKQVPEWAEIQRAAVLEEYASLDRALDGREFIARDTFSMADVVAFTSIDFGKPSNLRIADAQPNLKRWYAAINARPSARA
ncbi:MAG TPA: glutathione S-transferase family protein [Steroidobacteraceae bacterium]|nr:glutathione S-transferase family protein [Steroidobacteraceae bacterium]